MEPESVGPYRVIETVTVDGPTVTVRARRGREPSVLVKRVRAAQLNVASVSRDLEQEAEFLLAHRHATWPTVVEVLREPSSAAVVFVDRGGHRLDTVIRRAGRLEPSVALAIAIEVAQSVGALHRAGLAHGALHAGLVELTVEGGVCVHFAPAGHAASAALAEPDHMAPEQILGEPPDALSDVFLLGALLYRMLTGREPFASDGEGEGVSQRIRHQAPPPLAREVPSVPLAVHAVISRCLSKRRHERVADAASFSARLTRELRRTSSLPLDALIVHALVQAGLAEGFPPPLERGVDRGSAMQGRVSRRGLVVGGAALVAALIGFVLWQAFAAAPLAEQAGARGVLSRPARLRVLARPWAEVVIDGERVDVTPLGSPIDVSAGRHAITLRHPAAPDVSRVVDVSSGELVLIDVEMDVSPSARPSPSGMPSASAAPESP